ncbi:MAG TPA: zinc-binding dehydrogenase [bacterium]|nr:zinc-binding dehydrogenase [bacterium]HPR88858.1 zinc-binding dehydrogenase [bacterium]
MKAAILYGPQQFVIEEREMPVIGPEDVLVRTTACGVCTGEVEMWEGRNPNLRFPIFIGHEASGVVVAAGEHVQGFVPGDHVAAWIEGKGYAEYFATPAGSLFRLQPQTPMELALGEPIACAVNGVRKADIQFNESVGLVGCGFMGLIMLQVLRVRGAGMLIAIDTREDILQLARNLGADHTFNPRTVDAVTAVRELTHGQGVDVGIEAAGRQETLDMTAALVRMEGKLEVFGFHQGGARTVDWGYWNWMAFRIINGHSRSAHLYIEGMHIGLELLEAGKLNMGPLVTHRFPLLEINTAFKTASAKAAGFVKGAIVF